MAGLNGIAKIINGSLIRSPEAVAAELTIIDRSAKTINAAVPAATGGTTEVAVAS